MAKKFCVSDFIVPLNFNGLHGRMLHAPARQNKTKNLLLVYGHHSSIERMAGFIEALTRYGNVTVPDLPGFGGMDSFYKIGEKPSIDNLADYLAAFIKLRFKRKRITILGMSFGFLIVTRMLQKYPEIAKKVDLLVSVVGFVHKDDFILPKRIIWPLLIIARIGSCKYPALFLKMFFLREPLIRACYALVSNRHSKLKDADVAEKQRRIDFEIELWKCNDIRTYFNTTIAMLTANVCDVQVQLRVHHVAVEVDRYFDNHRVEQHLAVVYHPVYTIHARQTTHAPTVIASAKEAEAFIPPQLRRLLAK